jgi:hypothetical protein
LYDAPLSLAAEALPDQGADTGQIIVRLEGWLKVRDAEGRWRGSRRGTVDANL